MRDQPCKADPHNQAQEGNMNRKELVSALANQTSGSRADADRNVTALIEIISQTLDKGDKITLSGFGTFGVRDRAARIGRNPKNGAAVQIKASRIPTFKASDHLKTALNGDE